MITLLAACSTVSADPPPTPLPEVIGQPETLGEEVPVAFSEDIPPCDARVLEQSFENGRMFWLGRTPLERCKTDHTYVPGTGVVWVVLFNDEGGEWLAAVSTWDPDTETQYITLPPLEGVSPITEAFGKVWQLHLTAEQREQLGWAVTPTVSHVTTYSYADGIHRLNSVTGDVFRFDVDTRRVTIDS